MTPSDLAFRFHAAQSIARECGVLMKRRFHDRETMSFTFKGHQDYITEVDGQVETLVRARLGALFPHDGIIGEEGGGEATRSVWVIDPIDGTANFARGLPHFCISIAFVQDNAAVIGVIYDCVRDELFTALRGAGAWLNYAPMRVSTTATMATARVEVGGNLRKGAGEFIAMIDRVTATGASMIHGGSGALGVAYVAAGRTDGYCETHIHPWDVLAALVMVREAGGITNDYLAGAGLTRGNPVLACNPHVLDAMLLASRVRL